MLINKQLFTDAMNALKAQDELETRLHEHGKLMFEDDFPEGSLKCPARDGLLTMLKRLCGDDHRDSWIEYYIFEIEWGAKNLGPVEIGGVQFDMATLDDLWTVLNVEHK